MKVCKTTGTWLLISALSLTGACTHKYNQSATKDAKKRSDQIVAGLQAKIEICARKKLKFPSLTSDQQALMKEFHQTFQASYCESCHNVGHALTDNGHMTMSGTQSEFEMSLAARHHNMKRLLKVCIGPEKVRKKIEDKLNFTVRAHSELGDPYFSMTGNTRRDHDIVATFTMGKFEDKQKPGDRQFDITYKWMKNGAPLSLERFSKFLSQYIRLHGFHDDVQIDN